MNKKILYFVVGLVALALIGWGIVAKIKPKGQPVPNQNPFTSQNQQINDKVGQLQFNDKVNQLMGVVNNPNSTKSEVVSAWLKIGIYYEGLGQRDKEEQAFLKASETDPDSYLPWSNLATFYTDAKKYDKASQDFQKAISLNDKDPQLWLKWINFMRYNATLTDARIRQAFNDAYKATNNNDMLLRQGANYLEETNDIPGAIAAWQFIFKLNPNDLTAQAEITRLQKLLKS